MMANRKDRAEQSAKAREAEARKAQVVTAETDDPYEFYRGRVQLQVEK